MSAWRCHLLHCGGEAGHRARIRQQPRHQTVIQLHIEREAATVPQLFYELRHLARQTSSTYAPMLIVCAHLHPLSRSSTQHRDAA